METRTIEQVRVFKLLMNPMPSNFENFRIVALSYDENKLKEFVENEKVEPYKDGKWHKTFKQGGPLEWMNPMNWNENTYRIGNCGRNTRIHSTGSRGVHRSRGRTNLDISRYQIRHKRIWAPRSWRLQKRVERNIHNL